MEERLQQAERLVEDAAEENADSCSDAESETAPSDRGYRKSCSDAEPETAPSDRGYRKSRSDAEPETAPILRGYGKLNTINLEPGLAKTPKVFTAEQYRDATRVMRACRSYDLGTIFCRSHDLGLAGQTSHMPLTLEDRELEIEVENLRAQVRQLTQDKIDLTQEAEALRAEQLKRSRPGKSQRADKKKQFEEPAALAPLRTASSNRRTKQMQFVRT